MVIKDRQTATYTPPTSPALIQTSQTPHQAEISHKRKEIGFQSKRKSGSKLSSQDTAFSWYLERQQCPQFSQGNIRVSLCHWWEWASVSSCFYLWFDLNNATPHITVPLSGCLILDLSSCQVYYLTTCGKILFRLFLSGSMRHTALRCAWTGITGYNWISLSEFRM